MSDLGVHQPLPFTLALDRALVLTRRHIRRVYLPVAVPMAVCATLMMVAHTLTLQPLLAATGMGGEFDAGSFNLASCGASVILFLAYLVLGVLTQGVLFFAASDALEGRPIRMAEAWRAVLRPSTLGTLVLFFGALGVGTVLCILPGLVVYALFLWTLPVMRSEGRVGFDALERSARLALHHPPGRFFAALKVLGAGLMGLVLNQLTSALVQLPFQIPAQIHQATTGDLAGPLWLNVPMSLLSSLVLMAVTVYVIFAQTLLYLDTRRRAEGGDLEAAVDGLYALHGLPLTGPTPPGPTGPEGGTP